MGPFPIEEGFPMLFFVAILALAAISMLLIRAMALEGRKPAFLPRERPAKTHRLPASALLDAASLRGLY